MMKTKYIFADRKIEGIKKFAPTFTVCLKQ